MEKKIVDARGELCPKPLIMTKKALKGFTGEIEILLDNLTACENVTRYLSDNGVVFSSSGTGDDRIITINSESASSAGDLPDPDGYCTVPALEPLQPLSAKAGHVICFTKDTMGSGSDELGEILIKAFCNTIKEIEPLPKALVFYNGGVNLALQGSPVLESIQEVEKSGVKILVCGTCADYFGVKDKVGAGIISNMYDIMECLTGAGHIIYH